jgi:branched-chain amino acid transport system substrate-binding protein
MLRGAQLAASEINAQGGVLGRHLEIVAADDQADAAAGVEAAHRMVARKVVAVVGPFNSSVGVKNLPVYKKAGVSILRLTSATDTQGFGVTTQPMVTQIAPVEAQDLTQVLHVSSVAVLFDPSTYTAGITHQLVSLLEADQVAVPVSRALSPTATLAQRRSAVQAVAASHAQVTYLAMYGPEAGAIAKMLYPGDASASGQASGGRCFVDLAAQGPDFVQAAGTAAASACLNSGVPSATQLPGGNAYAAAYEARFHLDPGTWGAFTYDSVGLLAAAVEHSQQWRGPLLQSDLAHTINYQGVTGTITIQPSSGNRVDPPVVILDITSSGQYVVDRAWADTSGYSLPSG